METLLAGVEGLSYLISWLLVGALVVLTMIAIVLIAYKYRKLGLYSLVILLATAMLAVKAVSKVITLVRKTISVLGKKTLALDKN